jgi:arsenite-transporting ATPase
MRVLLFTGKGGVGKTTTAAATAVHAAARGSKTLVVSTDPAHSLADALGGVIGTEPTELDTGLYAQQVDAQREFEASWRDVQAYLCGMLEQAGVDALEAEELTVLPGADEVLALLALRAQVAVGCWDVIVVDCAPTGETLRLLALPDALRWWMQRVFPPERRLLRTLRPVVSQLTGLPLPPDAVLAALARLTDELAAVREVLTDPETTSVRLVLTPESVVLAETRRTLTSLALYGYRVDGVVANRIFPSSGNDADEWRSGWVDAQRRQLAEVEASFPGLPVWRVGYAAAEPIGLDALAALGSTVYAEHDPLALVSTPDPVTVERVGAEEFVLSVALPLAARRDVELGRRGDDLLVTVGSHRRALALPSVLRRCVVAGAGLDDGRLEVRFRPAPEPGTQL